MVLGNGEYRELARVLLATRPDEIDCERWLASVGLYLDLIGAGRPIPESLRPVEEHLRLCADCGEEYAAMREALDELRGSQSPGDPSGS
ncbi:MAG: hypothetical protein U0790_27865 [Isosphaeraceae bacterium]